MSFERAVACAEFAGERREIRVIAAAGLALTVHQPLRGETHGTVLLIPGWSGPRTGPAELLVFLAQRMAQAGWSAVRMDLPGRGDADGDFASTDLDAMIAAAVSVASAQQDGKPLVLAGICSGGNVALGTATAIPNPQSPIPNAVIALSALPFQPARSKGLERRRRWRNIKNYAARALSPRTWARLVRGEINLERVRKNVTTSEKPAAGERNPKDSARDIERGLLDWKGAALFVWGGGDEEAPPARAHFEKLHAAGMGSREHTVFHTIPGANHNFYARAWREELAVLILQFLNKARA